MGMRSDNITVLFDDVMCREIEVIEQQRSLRCVTSRVESSREIRNISISVNGFTFYSPDSTYFSYKVAKLSNYNPAKGIISGGTLITIEGENIGFQGSGRYNIRFCNEDLCIGCRNTTFVSEKGIKCLSSDTTETRNMTKLEIILDKTTVLILEKTYQYFPDPVITPDFNVSSIQSGGTEFPIYGQGFSNVGRVTVEDVEKPCDLSSDIVVNCEAPRLNSNDNISPDRPSEQSVWVHFDGLIVPFIIQYSVDPTFEPFSNINQYDGDSTIDIKGSNLLLGASKDNYAVSIGLGGVCVIIVITAEMITCFPPKTVPRTLNDDENIASVKVNVGHVQKYIGDLEYMDVYSVELIVGLIVAGVVVLIVVAVLIYVLVIKRKLKEKVKTLEVKLQQHVEFKDEIETRRAGYEQAVGRSDIRTQDIGYNELNSFDPVYDEIAEYEEPEIAEYEEPVSSCDKSNSKMESPVNMKPIDLDESYLHVVTTYEEPASRHDKSCLKIESPCEESDSQHDKECVKMETHVKESVS